MDFNWKRHRAASIDRQSGQHLSLGRRGESYVAGRFRAAGFCLLSKNGRQYAGVEHDLIVRKERRYYFVEVKTRSTHIEEATSKLLAWRQYQRLRCAAELYCNEHLDLIDEFAILLAYVHATNDGFRLQLFRLEGPQEAILIDFEQL
ncbi:MAG: YraN family protein [Eubacteriales bacterium]|nr:YraN family protein [Eubacteriales bacterium]